MSRSGHCRNSSTTIGSTSQPASRSSPAISRSSMDSRRASFIGPALGYVGLIYRFLWPVSRPINLPQPGHADPLIVPGALRCLREGPQWNSQFTPTLTVCTPIPATSDELVEEKYCSFVRYWKRYSALTLTFGRTATSIPSPRATPKCQCVWDTVDTPLLSPGRKSSS